MHVLIIAMSYAVTLGLKVVNDLADVSLTNWTSKGLLVCPIDIQIMLQNVIMTPNISDHSDPNFIFKTHSMFRRFL